MPRPTKLNADTQKRICDALRMGATYELAAQYGGVTYESLNNWRNRGAAEDDRRNNPRVKEGTEQWENEQPYFQFFHALQKAESEAVIGWLSNIEKAAIDGNWQAAAWKLERRYPDSYGRRRVDTDMTSGGEKLQIILKTGMSTDDL